MTKRKKATPKAAGPGGSSGQSPSDWRYQSARWWPLGAAAPAPATSVGPAPDGASASHHCPSPASKRDHRTSAPNWMPTSQFIARSS